MNTSPQEILTNKLFQNCIDEKFVGHDPFDGLEAKRFPRRLLKYPLVRLATIQLFKRSPINLRTLLGVPKGVNPKGVALALSTSVRLNNEISDDIFTLLKSCASEGYSNFCIGYNFDWQNRVFYLPKGTPTVVNTAFAGHAFIDYYRKTNSSEALSLAKSCCEFILRDLNIQSTPHGKCVSYSPLDLTKVHNANLLAAGLLARVHNIRSSTEYLENAFAFMQHSLSMQNDDGSWVYGSAKSQQFIDSFHTGFNLEQAYIANRVIKCSNFDEKINAGNKYYLDNFFLKDGTPKYYHDSVFPIDAHSPAQLFSYCGVRSLPAEVYMPVLNYVIKNLIDNDKVFYRKNRFYTNKIHYMRWSQLWMCYGLSKLVQKIDI